MATLSPAAARALRDAVATKGKHKGMLLKRCPASNTLAAAAWQGAMMVCNPYQVSIAACMFMTPEQRAIMHEVTACLEQFPKARMTAMQRDRATLESLGVW
jgi:hypothetical protein